MQASRRRVLNVPKISVSTLETKAFLRVYILGTTLAPGIEPAMVGEPKGIIAIRLAIVYLFLFSGAFCERWLAFITFFDELED